MKVLKRTGCILLLCFFALYGLGFAAEKKNFATKPKLNNGKKWRIAYYEGGPFVNYPLTLVSTVNGLMKKGWIEKAKIPEPKDTDTIKLWQWMRDNLKSDYLEFVKDGHYTANWNKNDKEARKKTTQKVINRLKTRKDIDLIIAMGTWAGQDLANDQHITPTIVCSTSDPIRAEIIKSEADSGFSHLHAKVDPTLYQRQIKVFHDIIGFKTLGVAFRDTVSGHSYSAIADVERMAKEMGFEVKTCLIPEDAAREAEGQKLLDCYKKLSEQVDAVYVTTQTGVNKRSIKDISGVFIAKGIPSFSQPGIKFVKYGLLMSISQAGVKYIGDFHAETMAKVFNGAKPGELNQVFKEPLSIAINLKTAELIGYDPPVDVIGAADQIFEKIEVYKKKKK
ncbi:ABC transporter substrate-binding protein [Desulfospira joergensenii]|uniref:ABC transporter substrate-binding protein n=1 Tax=Desulfospira joergensenii TaxID=53329 RepID=UPI0003B5C57C|nr:ABC transporter substrate binding protein [Desulfospira joergensenii]